MNTKMQIEWTDLLEMQLLNLRPSRQAAALLGLFFGLVALGCVIVAIKSTWETRFIMLLVAAGMAFGIHRYRYVTLPNFARRTYEQQKALHLPSEIEVTTAGLACSNELGHSTYPWKDFCKWKENGILLLLYLSDVLPLVLPKRYLSDALIDAIKEQLDRNHVPQPGQSINKQTGCLFIWVCVATAMLFYQILLALK